MDKPNQIGRMLSAVWSVPTLNMGMLTIRHLAIFVACAGFLLVAQLAQRLLNDLNVIRRVPTVARAVVYAGVMLAFVLFGAYDGQAFIYFQF